MESVLNKSKIKEVARMDSDGDNENIKQAQLILALIEIREAIEDGFQKLDQTHIEAALMLVGCKETLDCFLEERLAADKVLASVEKVVRATTARTAAPVKAAAAEIALAVVAAANESGKVETEEKPAEPADNSDKSAVTLDAGDSGLVPDGSGKT